MRKILFLTIFLLGCQKINQYPVELNLGKTPEFTKINKVFPSVSKGPITVELLVTEGAKYSLQILDISENQIKTFGFTANNAIYIKDLDLSDLKSGDYSLVLIDITGRETKVNFVIKK